MLITNMLPLLSHYSLSLVLVAGADDTVTLTVIPRKAEGSSRTPEAGEVRPISFTATAAEIDAELAKGADGALGELVAARKSLGDQLAEQKEAAEAAKKAATSKAKPAPAAAKAPAPAPAAKPEAVSEPKPGEPVSLWEE